MSRIQINLPVTAHVKGPLFDPHGPCTINSSLGDGVVAIAPNTPFVIERDEGLRLVERWKDRGAKIISENVAEPPPAAPIGRKTIVLDFVTLHVAGPNHAPRIIRRSDAFIQVGKVDIVAIAPGTPVTLDAAQADRLLAKHAGHVVEEDAP